jgi:hypothetical protein
VIHNQESINYGIWVAHHEAGHALVHVLIGNRLRWVSAHPTSDEGYDRACLPVWNELFGYWLGMVNSMPVPAIEPTLDDIAKMACTHLAGTVAEERFGFRDPKLDDFLARWDGHSTSTPLARHKEIFDTLGAMKGYFGGDTEKARSFVRAQLLETRRLINEHWVAVQALASPLSVEPWWVQGLKAKSILIEHLDHDTQQRIHLLQAPEGKELF